MHRPQTFFAQACRALQLTGMIYLISQTVVMNLSTGIGENRQKHDLAGEDRPHRSPNQLFNQELVSVALDSPCCSLSWQALQAFGQRISM